MLEKKETIAESAAIEAAEPAGLTKTPNENGKAGRKKNSRKKKMIKKAVIIAVLIVVVVAGASIFLGGKNGEPQGIPVMPGSVTKQDLAQEVSIKGTIQGSESAEITSALNYEITSVHVEEGDRVTEGQVLATLDGGELTDQYKKAQIAYNQSKTDYDTAESLYAEGAIAKTELDKAKATYDNDLITLNSFNGLEDTKIKSPITGTVTRVNVTKGRMAKDTEDNEAMFVVEDLDNLQMKVKISEYDISKIKIGQQVTITADVLGTQTVTGTVSKISPTGEQKESSSKEMVIPVVIDVNNENSSLIAGVTAKATILIEKKEGVLTVPLDAIVEEPTTGELSVFVIKEDGTLKKVVVTTGLEGDFNTEITSGELSEGDQIVLGATYDMTDGMQVILNNAAEM